MRARPAIRAIAAAFWLVVGFCFFMALPYAAPVPWLQAAFLFLGFGCCAIAADVGIGPTHP